MGDDAEPLIEFFKDANINAVMRVVERARSMAEKEARRNASANRVPRRAGALVRCMNKAMSAYGRSTKGRASIRHTAPDTGGRPFHYSHTTVTKGGSARGHASANEARPTTTTKTPAKRLAGPPGARSAKPGSTQEGKHQVYLERAKALEQGIGLEEWRAVQTEMVVSNEVSNELGVDTHDIGSEQDTGLGTGRDTGPGNEDGKRPKRETGKEQSNQHDRSHDQVQRWVDSVLSMEPGLSGRTTEQAAQEYIEDTAKALDRRTGKSNSFGTIGETLGERLRFWDLVQEHETEKGGRTQTRLVLELPHEATPRQRHEIVRQFTDEFQTRGIPYWASIHAPTGRNDDRNHHAHVVLTERPMRQMPHPETGELVWDFTIREEYQTTSRNTRARYPYRQTRDPAMRDRGYVRASRARFAAVVNTVMANAASPVRYDPRSYEAMGVDTAPMRNVARVLADKLDKRQFVVMDAEWTRRTIDAEMQAASARRDATFTALQQADQRLRDVAQEAKRSKTANAKLPPHLRLSPGRVLARKAQDLVMTQMLGVRRDRLATKFVDEATLAALRHIEAATAPPQVGGRTRRVHDPATTPDPEDLAALHAATKEEIAALGLTSRARQASFTAREAGLAREWREGGPGSGRTTPEPPGAGTANGKTADKRSGAPGREQAAQPPPNAQQAARGLAPQTAPTTQAATPDATGLGQIGEITARTAAQPQPGITRPASLDPAAWNRGMAPGQVQPFWLRRTAQLRDLDDEAEAEPQRTLAPSQRNLRPWELNHAPGGIMESIAAPMKAAITHLAEAAGGDAPTFVDALDAMMRDMAASAARRRGQEAAEAREREEAVTRRRGIDALRPKADGPKPAKAMTPPILPTGVAPAADSARITAAQDAARARRETLTNLAPEHIPQVSVPTPAAPSPKPVAMPTQDKPEPAQDPSANAPPARRRPPEPLPPLVYEVTLEGDHKPIPPAQKRAALDRTPSGAAAASKAAGNETAKPDRDRVANAPQPPAAPAAPAATASIATRAERPATAGPTPHDADPAPTRTETGKAPALTKKEPADQPDNGAPKTKATPETTANDVAAREKAAEAARKRRRKAILANRRDGPER